MEWLYLSISILAEVTATTALKASGSFTRLLPSLVVVTGYGISFYFLSLAIQRIPLGVAYAIWSAVGVVLVSTAGALLFAQRLSVPVIAGMTLIVAGVIVINLFSPHVVH
ncbi:DMT family transporter [Aromatoleum petrolei]|uniref:QacE family quaternary ammonium compound efflux SMR transporter n=1 Tax=Aromatoleum petrolei TaxID=76116 RepID=A0ABX1MHB3_9RHOO|nr:multidrug efflux SMR transporter [Aromatoleum petrolei]NMF87334.1 QacE family quaternary ammonium compound efflux SMR transporter [Aromatoleum petrolei]QTQ38581.1 Small multidrug resistance family protein [Aromatoleum petrolei]